AEHRQVVVAGTVDALPDAGIGGGAVDPFADDEERRRDPTLVQVTGEGERLPVGAVVPGEREDTLGKIVAANEGPPRFFPLCMAEIEAPERDAAVVPEIVAPAERGDP